jgi:hypothetical protein
MPSGTLYILLEGNDDERFFRRLLVPRLLRFYRSVKIWKYAREKRRRTIKFIRVLQRTGKDILYVRDLDSAPSVKIKKEEIQACYEHAIPDPSIIVVVMEIESWYLAGPPAPLLKSFGIILPDGSTDTLTKEEFYLLIPPRMARTQFMNELLAHYDFEWAMRRNASFEYFMTHWLRKH